ncbi:RHS repeat-associated core domain-containing protein [Myxococcus sp. CA039A]|uniref:RHS repeat-associated core domain-containing protein n=1 Tax=Myxococcus sp. CA039A TaxID=2741737 RepID=UPI00157AC90A|nr:RHS repeat-associated core domain-containing protein [Myxococcus sp. CA039A]NTX55886.1 RHS repeat-associated core domain-containing protein [Myxococcus sp. CA039A]
MKKPFESSCVMKWNVMKKLALPRRWSFFAGGLAIFLVGLGAYALDEDVLSEEEIKKMVEQATLNPLPPLGGPGSFGASPESRVALGSLKPTYSHSDMTLDGVLGDLKLTRIASGPVGAWNVGAPGKMLGSPFGYAGIGAGKPYPRLRWWHNLYSFIAHRYEYETLCENPPNWPDLCLDLYAWDLYGGPAGTMTSFDDCGTMIGTDGCFGTNFSEQSLKIQLVGESIVVHAPDGRYFYNHKDNRGHGSFEETLKGFRTWDSVTFLSYIEPKQYDEGSCAEEGKEDAGTDLSNSCHRRIARLYYDVPTECAGSSPEETAQTLGAASPVLRSAVALSGDRLIFHYQRLLSRVPTEIDRTHECVLSSVDLQGKDGAVETSVVTYHYLDNKAGLLSRVEWPDRAGGTVTGAKLEYAYTVPGSTEGWEVKRDGVVIVRQSISANNVVVKDTDGDGDSVAKNTFFVSAEANGCPPGYFEGVAACRSQDQYFISYGATLGDGTGTTVSEVARTFKMTLAGVNPQGDQGPRLTSAKVTASCGGACVGVEPNPPGDGWFIDKLGNAVDVASGAKHSNGAYTVYGNALAADPAVLGKPFLPPAELQHVYLGAENRDGGSALLERDYTYVYGGVGRPVARRGYEQLVETDSDVSVFADENPLARVGTRRQRDPVTNRLTAVVKSGHSLGFSPTTNTWLREDRHVGVFYLTHDACSGQGTPDALGRIRTVMGPCEVAGSLSTTCDMDGNIPISVYDYWDGSTADSRSGRLKAKKIYPAGCTSAPITTALDSYDVRGQLLQLTDANGDITKFEYEGTQLVKKTTALGHASWEAVTEYGFDDNASHGDYIRHPDGRYEVLCFRKNTVAGQGCVGGVRTALLQWRAYSSVPSGATHAERVDYTYHLGVLRSESFRDATNQVRRTRYYEGDPLERMTFESWGATGPSVSSATNYSQTRLFDTQGNQVGLGSPYQPTASAPDPLCGGFDPNSLAEGLPRQPASPHCKAFEYDRLNRLTGLLEPVDTASTSGDAVKMCLSYDRAGNLKSVRQGCPRGAGAAGDCSLCGQPRLEYRHDDFGNLVRMDAPWGSGPQEFPEGPAGRGRYHFEYDVAGNLVKKQTPSMAAAADPQWVENTYDSMGRTLKAEAAKSVGGVISRETLFAYFYDQTLTPPWGCPGYSSVRPARAMGRAQVLTDSFGDTWYQYDAHGNTMGSFRGRAQTDVSPRTSMCFEERSTNHPSHLRWYDRAGRLSSESYPGGRGIHYLYHEGAQSHRISAIRVTEFDGVAGTGWGGFLTIVDDVRWEPFGGLRSYVLNAPKAPAGAQKARVEYHVNGLNQPIANCSITAFSSGADTTGRLAGVSVSKTEAGGSLGDIFKRVYTWKADQLLQEDTCLLETGNVSPHTVRYADASTGAAGYDARLQLLSAYEVANASSSAAGAFSGRTYEYDARGNRTLDVQDGWRFKGEYDGIGSRVDLLTARYLEGSQCGGTLCTPRFSVTQRYDYDQDGRVSRIASYKNKTDSVASPFYALELDASMSRRNAAVGAVYRQVSDNEGRMYEYFYDAFGRRRLKRYFVSAGKGPLQDEFFYENTRLYEDWGNTETEPATAESVRDEYIWLDGRPIAFFKSRVTQAGQRLVDFAGDCPRNDEAAPCGLYFLISDGQGKPVLALDSFRRVTGAADYDPYGQVNRTTLVADAPVLALGTNALMATAQVPTSGAVTSHFRARFSILDVASGSGVYLADGSGAALYGVDGLPTLLENVTSFGAVSKWTVPAAGGVAQIRFQAASTAGAVQDAALGSVEYRRFQTGASPVWTPLRFPGQYHDVETDFFENWSRYYDPSIGRYLGPDPLLVSPKYLSGAAGKGMSVPVYVYAHNNPVLYTDPSGKALPLLVVLVCVSGVCEVAVTAVVATTAAVAATATAAYVAAKVTAHISENSASDDKEDSASSDKGAPKLPLPRLPPGMKQAEFGRRIKWPTGRAGQPRPEVGESISRGELDALGVDEGMAEEWRDLYDYETKHRPNPSSEPRREYMDKVLEVLRSSRASPTGGGNP